MAKQQVDAYGGTIFSGAGEILTRRPQDAFAQMRAAAPAMRMEGSGVVVTTRAAMMEVFRHPEIYSSQMPAGHLGNVRPLIPIEVDPPDQRKFRKILDPLFAPKHLEHLTGPIESLVNDLIDGVPVTVSYCDLTDCVRTYTDRGKSAPLEVAVAGLFEGREMVLEVGGRLYFHKSGEPLKPGEGPSSLPLEQLSPTRTTWERWRRDHPSTGVYQGNR